MLKWLRLLIIVSCFSLQSKAQFTSVYFSVQAHQDDWQLFMSSRIIADMSVANRKMVFITLTAGDESCGPCSYGTIPFYLGRENGSVYSSKFVADLTTGTTPLAVPAVTNSTPMNGHTIAKYVYKNTVNYFLRLPDGDVSGAGFGNNGGQSLEKLKNGGISAISTIGVFNGEPVEPHTTYTSWTDLTNTIKAIINAEKIVGTQSWIETAYTINGSQTAYNTNDHSDHRYSSLAIQEAVSSMLWLGINGFMDYNSSSQGANLGETDHENATTLFALATVGMTEGTYQNDFASNHQQWLPMDYFQQIRNAFGNATFSGTGDDPESAKTTNAVIDNEKSAITPLSEMPLIVSITSPAFTDKDIRMFISPYEAGQLVTSVYDMAGNKIYDLKTKIENRDGFFVTLKDAIKVKGTYIIKSILNDKFIETRKIVVE